MLPISRIVDICGVTILAAFTIAFAFAVATGIGFSIWFMLNG